MDVQLALAVALLREVSEQVLSLEVVLQAFLVVASAAELEVVLHSLSSSVSSTTVYQAALLAVTCL